MARHCKDPSTQDDSRSPRLMQSQQAVLVAGPGGSMGERAATDCQLRAETPCMHMKLRAAQAGARPGAAATCVQIHRLTASPLAGSVTLFGLSAYNPISWKPQPYILKPKTLSALVGGPGGCVGERVGTDSQLHLWGQVPGGACQAPPLVALVPHLQLQILPARSKLATAIHEDSLRRYNPAAGPASRLIYHCIM